MRRLGLLIASTFVLLATMGPAAAHGHAERATYFPDASKGEVPTYRTKGPSRVVCKPDSRTRIKESWKGRGKKRTRIRRSRLRTLKRCEYEHIQAAVDAASSGERIIVMPGVYREEPSRAVPDPRDPASPCRGDEYWEESGDKHQEDGRVPTFRHQAECPNAWSLIAIIGDSLADEDRECDRKCDLQVQGMGRRARDTVIEGDRFKEDVIRADRADGFVLRNVTVEQGRFNNVNVVETNGFRLAKLVTRYGRNYGVLTFASDHGLYTDIESYGQGDGGIYPGSGPEGGCKRFGIEIRRVNSYGNMLGTSGTAGNGTWIHDSKMHHNGTGAGTDSFAPGHPGMPQDCSKWENNEIYSNNVNFFDDRNEEYCNSTRFEDRPKEVVCPWFQVPVGTGIMMYGANRNVITGNRIWDNWRSGIRLFWVPGAVRGEDAPDKQFDTSNGNRFVDNTFSLTPAGTVDPNGIDMFWDEEGVENCWEGNRGAAGDEITSDPATLPTCASGGSQQQVGNMAKLGLEVPCAAWHPQDNSDPPGCDWFTTPPEPQP